MLANTRITTAILVILSILVNILVTNLGIRSSSFQGLFFLPSVNPIKFTFQPSFGRYSFGLGIGVVVAGEELGAIFLEEGVALAEDEFRERRSRVNVDVVQADTDAAPSE